MGNIQQTASAPLQGFMRDYLENDTCIHGHACSTEEAIEANLEQLLKDSEKSILKESLARAHSQKLFYLMRQPLQFLCSDTDYIIGNFESNYRGLALSKTKDILMFQFMSGFSLKSTTSSELPHPITGVMLYIYHFNPELKQFELLKTLVSTPILASLLMNHFSKEEFLKKVKSPNTQDTAPLSQDNISGDVKGYLETIKTNIYLAELRKIFGEKHETKKLSPFLEKYKSLIDLYLSLKQLFIRNHLINAYGLIEEKFKQVFISLYNNENIEENTIREILLEIDNQKYLLKNEVLLKNFNQIFYTCIKSIQAIFQIKKQNNEPKFYAKLFIEDEDPYHVLNNSRDLTLIWHNQEKNYPAPEMSEDLNNLIILILNKYKSKLFDNKSRKFVIDDKHPCIDRLLGRFSKQEEGLNSEYFIKLGALSDDSKKKRIAVDYAIRFLSEGYDSEKAFALAYIFAQLGINENPVFNVKLFYKLYQFSNQLENDTIYNAILEGEKNKPLKTMISITITDLSLRCLMCQTISNSDKRESSKFYVRELKESLGNKLDISLEEYIEGWLYEDQIKPDKQESQPPEKNKQTYNKVFRKLSSEVTKDNMKSGNNTITSIDNFFNQLKQRMLSQLDKLINKTVFIDKACYQAKIGILEKLKLMIENATDINDLTDKTQNLLSQHDTIEVLSQKRGIGKLFKSSSKTLTVVTDFQESLDVSKVITGITP